MNTTDDLKFIWQTNSPAPYESGWSVFTKIVTSNAFKPRTISEYISNPNRVQRTIKYWTSEWIDFQKFSNALNINETRLRQCFLDCMGFYIPDRVCSKQLGIKFCNECLRLGYHCTFFQLPFIHHCPWHATELSKPCITCTDTINHIGFKLNSNEFNSSCNHIHFIQHQISTNDNLSDIQKFCINESCMDFVLWWKNVSTNPEISMFLTSVTYNTYESLITKFLHAAESIAGKSPWYIDYERHATRTISWTDSHEKIRLHSDTSIVERKTETDINYRSVRRHFYKRFIKAHRKCWNEISNISFFEAQNLNRQSMCTLVLAYVTWRLSIENFINIESIKSNKQRNKQLKILMNYSRFSSATEREKCALLYAYFFYIWDDIQDMAEKGRFSIVKDSDLYIKTFAFVQDNEEWHLMFPNPSQLESKSFARCVGTLKPKYCMSSNLVDVTPPSWREYDGYSSHTMFRLEDEAEGIWYTFIHI